MPLFTERDRPEKFRKYYASVYSSDGFKTFDTTSAKCSNSLRCSNYTKGAGHAAKNLRTEKLSRWERFMSEVNLKFQKVLKIIYFNYSVSLSQTGNYQTQGHRNSPWSYSKLTKTQQKLICRASLILKLTCKCLHPYSSIAWATHAIIHTI